MIYIPPWLKKMFWVNFDFSETCWKTLLYPWGFKKECLRSTQHQVAARRNIESLLCRIININIEFLTESHLSQITFSVRLINKSLMMMNCFCGMVDRQKAFSFISSRGYCQRSSASRISNTPRGRLNLRSTWV